MIELVKPSAWYRRPLAIAACVASLALSACASIPEPIRTPVNGPSLDETRQQPDKSVGRTVRWGGRILEIDNSEDRTRLHVLGRKLSRSGRPLNDDYTPGRFIAEVPDFLEPEQYQPGREITVVGVVEGSRTESIGDHPYRFPVVRVDAIHLWQEVAEYEPYPDYYRYPYYYDPFYFPFRYHYYDYYRPHRHYRGRGHRHKPGGVGKLRAPPSRQLQKKN